MTTKAQNRRTSRKAARARAAAAAADVASPLEVFLEFARPDVKVSVIATSASFTLAPVLDGDRYIAGYFNADGALIAVKAPEDKLWKVLDSGKFLLVDQGLAEVHV